MMPLLHNFKHQMVDVNTVSYRLRFVDDDENHFSDDRTSCRFLINSVEDRDDNSLYSVEIDHEAFFGLLVKLDSPQSMLSPHKGRRYIVKWFVNHELILFRTEERRREYETSLRKKHLFVPFVENCQLPVKTGKSDFQLSKDDFFETVEEIGTDKLEVFNKVVTLPLHLFDLPSSRSKPSSVSSDIVNSLRVFTIDIHDGESMETSFQKSGLGDLYQRLI